MKFATEYRMQSFGVQAKPGKPNAARFVIAHTNTVLRMATGLPIVYRYGIVATRCRPGMKYRPVTAPY